MKKGDRIGPRERFHILEFLGEGSYGKVWKVFDDHMKREVAIKMMHKGKDAVERLVSEAVLGGLGHKNIVEIHEYLLSEGIIVMEYVEGKSLEKLLKEHILKGDWPSVAQISAIVEQLFVALQYAHENKRIHGDIKPDNILVPDRGQTKISDFGVAMALSPATGMPITSSTSKNMKGSVSYAAPEIQESGPRVASVQSDLYSAGLVTYLLLTKKHPFAHSSGLFKIPDLIKRRSYSITPPRQIDSQISETWETLVLRLLQHDPEKRPGSATEVLELITPKPLNVPCPDCAYENSPEALYCSKCGTKLVIEISKPSAQGILSQAHKAFFMDQKPEEAEQLLRRNLAEFRKKNVTKAFWLLAFILNKRRKYDEAKKFALEGQKMDPNLVELYRVLSYAESQLGNFTQAIEQLDKALEKATTPYIRAEVLYQKGRTHYVMGDLESACKDAKQALGHYPMHTKAIRLRDTVCV